MSAPRRARQAGVGVVVVGLHLVGVVAWWTQGRDAPTAPHAVATLAPITVWLPALPKIFPPQAKPPTRQQTPPPAVPRQDDSGVPSTAAAQATEPTIQDATAMSSAERAPALAAAPPASALNLTLSRSALQPLAAPSFADQSPFHKPLPATVERQIAAAAESGPWTEERIDNDHFRLRSGTTCIMLERPQAAALDPFSDASRRMPWRASRSKC